MKIFYLLLIFIWVLKGVRVQDLRSLSKTRTRTRTSSSGPGPGLLSNIRTRTLGPQDLRSQVFNRLEVRTRSSVQRWIKFSVLLLGSILFFYLFPLFGDGPVWDFAVERITPGCENAIVLLKKFLFIDNFDDSDAFGEKTLKVSKLCISSGECYKVLNRVFVKIELGMDSYKMREVLQFHIIVISKLDCVRSQFTFKNYLIIEHPIGRKTLKSFY
jgi:hypothetical protein